MSYLLKVTDIDPLGSSEFDKDCYVLFPCGLTESQAEEIEDAMMNNMDYYEDFDNLEDFVIEVLSDFHLPYEILHIDNQILL